MSICEQCGGSYKKVCHSCQMRSTTWGIDGCAYIINLAKTSKDIPVETLISVVEKYYKGKSVGLSRQVRVLKTSLEFCGYTGNFIGSVWQPKLGGSFKQIRNRDTSSAHRQGWRNDCCDMCGNTDTLELHHIIPLSWGGKSIKENCTTLCKRCHRKTHKKLSKYLNRTQLLKYLEPHIEEIKFFVAQCI